jgi:hypothetical protein
MPDEDAYVWRFRLETPDEPGNGAVDPEADLSGFIRRQFESLLSFAVLFENGRKVFPDQFSLVVRPEQRIPIRWRSSDGHAGNEESAHGR